MRDDELAEILLIVPSENLLEKKQTFDSTARGTGSLKIARGHPSRSRLVGGKHAHCSARLRRDEVGHHRGESPKECPVCQIAIEGSAQSKRLTYRALTSATPREEVVLERFARRPEKRESHTTELYAGIGKELGIEIDAVIRL